MKFIIVLMLISTQAISKLPKLDALLDLPTIDVENEFEKDALVSAKDQPLRFATNTNVEDVFLKNNKGKGGQWDQLSDGSWVWRLMVHSKESNSLGFGLRNVFLPPGAELSFYDWTGDLAKGPYNDESNKLHKELWTGPIIGDTTTIELKVSEKYKKYVSLSLENISQGYRSIWDDVDLIPKLGQQKFWTNSETEYNVKSGSCNVDVICDDGDGWRDQIRAVARYTITKTDGTFLCTGQMLNNTANDGKPMFLTANHCGFDSSNDSTINIWWNYESTQCRTPGSSQSGSPISINSFNNTQSGSTFRASYEASDMAILELDNIPNTSYQVFYSGWDRRDLAPSSAVGIHHPSGHAKRISFENDPTSITGYSQSVGGNTHIRIADWDTGTTEGGSSGSGLWNSNKLLVGQLHGGGAACGNDEADWYGRLFVSWTGGGTSNTRLQDWLDPNGTGVETLQELGGGCSQMNISINHTNSTKEIGIQQNFSSQVSGGTAPYTYKWDINADGETDGEQSSISATYAQKFTNNVSVSVIDAEGCTGGTNKAVVIEAPQIDLVTTGAAAQVCGNNNSTIDPGERWRIPVTLQNNGNADSNNSYAVFVKNANSTSFNVAASDNYGNTLGNCDRQFIDISTTGTELTIIDSDTSDGFSANDEGAAAVSLSETFNLYGKTISSLYLSTNGFISTNPNESGFDFDNVCPLPGLPSETDIARGSTTSARIIPLHDDLITQHIYHQHFNTCPRQSSPGEDLSCDVFMYKDVDLYDENDSTVEHFNFEAILYPSINLWVYQYDGIGINSASSSVGLQNDNATDGASFSCNSANSINTQEAVCVYHKNNPNTSGGDATKLFLETPAIALGDMQVSQRRSDFVTFSVDQGATTGSPIGIDMQASVYETGFNQTNTTLFSTTLGNNPVSNCSVNSNNSIQPTNGLWWNPNRSGNGTDMYFLDDRLIYVLYTALENRSPTWYITGAEDYFQNNQAYNDLDKHSFNGPFSTSSPRNVNKVGDSFTTLIDVNHAIQTRTINGQFSADLLEVFNFDNNVTTEQRTGLWYNPSEDGWGKTIGTQGNTEVVVSYLYDNNGQPYWLIGTGSNNTTDNVTMDYINVFCPHCPSIPLKVADQKPGNVRINYDSSNKSATLESMNININNGEHDTQWNRINMPLKSLLDIDSK